MHEFDIKRQNKLPTSFVRSRNIEHQQGMNKHGKVFYIHFLRLNVFNKFSAYVETKHEFNSAVSGTASVREIYFAQKVKLRDILVFLENCFVLD